LEMKARISWPWPQTTDELIMTAQNFFVWFASPVDALGYLVYNCLMKAIAFGLSNLEMTCAALITIGVLGFATAYWIASRRKK